jgi:hypothetical protein
MSLDGFTHAYITCALWSSTDPDNDDRPLDRDYDESDLSDDCRAKMVADCKAFQEANAEDLSVGDDEQAGHDFWLTRNGHGAGFWDGDWPEPQATRLTAACKAVGGCDLIVGDDGQIHCM